MVKEVYNNIYLDPEIRKIYDAINEREENYGGWAHHNFEHVCNVKNLASEIMTKLNFKEDYIEEAKIAAILHDTGAVEGKDGHAYRSYQFSKDYFLRKNIHLPDHKLVLEAIKSHSDGFDTDNVIQLVLILADKLDVKYTRPTKLGLEIPGNRQYFNIRDIKIDINQDKLCVYFITNGNMDKKEVEEYYFTRKISSAIKSFANKFKLGYKIYLDKHEWTEIYR